MFDKIISINDNKLMLFLALNNLNQITLNEEICCYSKTVLEKGEFNRLILSLKTITD